MCRNIKTLHNFEPPATAEEVEAAGLRSGGYFVVGDRYLVQSPNVAVERAVQDALR